MTKPSFSRFQVSDGVIALLLAVVTWILYALFALSQVNLYHDSFMYKPAFDLLHGNVLFKDIHLHYGPLSIYLHALSLSLFGTKLAVLKYETVFFYGLISVELFILFRQLLPRAWSALAVWFWIINAPFFFPVGTVGGTILPWPSVHALFLQNAGALFFLHGIKHSKAKAFFAAGLLIGLSLLCRQHTALAAIVLFSGAVLLNHRRAPTKQLSGAWFLGLFGVLLVATLVFYVQGNILLYLRQNYGILPQWSRSIHHTRFLPLGNIVGSFQNFFSFQATKAYLICTALIVPLWLANRWPQISRRIVVLLPLLFALSFVILLSPALRYQFTTALGQGFPYLSRLLALLTFLVLTWRAITNPSVSPRSSLELSLWTLSILSMGCQMELANQLDPPYLFWAMTPTFGLCFFYLRKFTLAYEGTAFTCLLVLIAAFTVTNWQMALPRWNGWDQGERLVKLHRPAVMNGISVHEKELKDWETLTNVVERELIRSAQRPFFTVGLQPIFTTLGTVSKNPGRFWFYADYFNDAEWKATVEEFIRKERPVLFVGPETTPLSRDELVKKWSYLPVATLPALEYEILSPQ